MPGVLGYLDGSYRFATGTWDIAGPGGAPWLLDGFGPPQRFEQHPYRWTTAARADVLVPMLMPEPHRVTVPIAANIAAGDKLDVIVRCNGAIVANAAIGPTWTTLTFDTDGRLGENEISFEAAVAPHRAMLRRDAPMPPMPPARVGVAIGPFRVALPR